MIAHYRDGVPETGSTRLNAPRKFTPELVPEKLPVSRHL